MFLLCGVACGARPDRVRVPALATEYAAFCAAYDLDFTSSPVRAYAACLVDGQVRLTPVSVVPAGTGIVVCADSTGVYDVPTTTGAETAAANELVATTERTAVPWQSADGCCNYILQGNHFLRANGGHLQAGRAYLHTPYDISRYGSADQRLELLLEQEEQSVIRLTGRLCHPWVFFLLGVALWFGGLWLHRWTRRWRK